MTIINPNSISGISSITALNSTAAINLFKDDGTSANVIAGVVTATTFKAGGIVRIANTNFNAAGNADELVIGTTDGNRGLTIVSGNTGIGALFFADDGSTNVGSLVYEHNTNQMRMNVAGQQVMRLDYATNNFPRWIIGNDLNTHISLPSADTFAFTTGGNERLRINSAGIEVTGHSELDNVSVAGVSTFSGVVRVPNGSAGAPAIHFGDSDSGVYGDSSNGVRLTAGGSDTIVATTNGVTFPPSVAALTSLTIGSQSAHTKPLYFADANNAQSGSILLDNSSQELRIKNGRFSGQITFTTYNTEKLRIDSGGRVLIGTDSSLNQYGSQSHLQVAGTSYDSSTIALRREQNNANPPGIVFAKSRSGTLGGNTIVQDDDQIGSLIFVAADGTDLTTVGAQIKVEVDGTPASNNIPGRIVFQTGGTAASNERLRITSTGNVGINAANPNSLLEVRGTAGTYTNGITVFTGNTTHSGSNAKNGVGLYSFGDALKGGLSSNLLYSNSSTPSQSYTTRSSGQIEIANTTSSNQTSLITFGGYYKGTTTFVERLRIEHDGNITFANSNSNATANLSSLIFANSTGEVSSIKGATRNGNTNGMIIFNTDISGTSSESMRVNHDGGFCVGTDSTRTAEFTHPDGFSIRSRDASKGQFQNTVTDVMGGLMNRDGSDGAILGFRREGSAVGHIGVNASTMYLNFGSTSASDHQLDDYEEGTATFALHIGGSEASGVSYTYNTAPYIKVGRMVWCAISMFATNLPTDTGVIDIVGLPFTDGGGGGYREPAFLAANHGGVTPSGTVITGALHGNNTKIRIRKNGNLDLNGSDIGSTFWMHGHITYMSST